MFGQTGAPEEGGANRTENVEQQPSIFWPVVGLNYGWLRHLKVHLVQHDILWPGREGSVHHIAKSQLYDVTHFIS